MTERERDADLGCPECGQPLTCRQYTHHEKVGIYAVTDSTSHAWQCGSCGEVALTLTDLAALQRRAAAIVLRDAKQVTGDVIRYARKSLGLRQVDLAELLDCASETLSRQENDKEPMSRPMQLALVAILDGVGLFGGDVDEFIAHERTRPSLHEFEVPLPRTG